MCFEDMPSGSSDDYMEATCNLFHDMAQLLLPKGASPTNVAKKQGKLLESFKNVQSDRHIVNKNYFEKNHI